MHWHQGSDQLQWIMKKCIESRIGTISKANNPTLHNYQNSSLHRTFTSIEDRNMYHEGEHNVFTKTEGVAYAYNGWPKAEV